MDIQSYQVEIEQDNTNKTSPKGSEVVMNDWLFRIPVEPRQTCEIEYLVKAVESSFWDQGNMDVAARTVGIGFGIYR